MIKVVMRVSFCLFLSGCGIHGLSLATNLPINGQQNHYFLNFTVFQKNVDTYKPGKPLCVKGSCEDKY